MDEARNSPKVETQKPVKKRVTKKAIEHTHPEEEVIPFRPLPMFERKETTPDLRGKVFCLSIEMDHWLFGYSNIAKVDSILVSVVSINEEYEEEDEELLLLVA